MMVRRSPAQTIGASPTGNNDTPGRPCCRHYVVLGLIFAAVAVYGSLVPFRYQPLTLQEAIERFRQLPHHSLATGGRADFAANFLLFVPIGYCWLGAFVVDRRFSARTVLALPLVILLAATLSVALEFCQLWFPLRFTSGNDVVAQAIGTVLGIGLWLTIGQTITDWVRSSTESANPRSCVDWLLQAYESRGEEVRNPRRKGRRLQAPDLGGMDSAASSVAGIHKAPQAAFHPPGHADLRDCERQKEQSQMPRTCMSEMGPFPDSQETREPWARCRTAQGGVRLDGSIVDVDPITGRAIGIRRLVIEQTNAERLAAQVDPHVEAKH